MEPILLDIDLLALEPVDTFESLVWTERYVGFGDFQVWTPISSSVVQKLAMDRYLQLPESEQVMIIESIGINTDIQQGNKIVFKGRSLETILERRIVEVLTSFVENSNLQDGIHLLLDENAIDPSNADRKINRLIFEASTDPAITALTFNDQFCGETLYRVITDLCLSKGIGYKITLTDDGHFKFKLYAGVDRSHNQSTIPYVVFSPEFDNIIKGEYFESKMSLKTVTLVAGEGEGSDRLTTWTNILDGAGTDLNRREIFTDAKDISKTIPGGTLTDPQYLAQLVQRGQENLAKNRFIQSFEGQADISGLYKYGEDFFMGDILQTANEYGHESQSRVSEIIRSQDSSGIKVYPSFTAV